jgi:hypothetical protein
MASRALSRLLGYFLLFVAFLLIAFGDFIFVNSFVRDLLILLGIIVAIFAIFTLVD